MEYSIYKDSSVENTVERIKNILKELNLEATEQFYEYPFKSDEMPFSLGLNIFGSYHVSNGKGATLKNARASAYSEFLERLQNHCLGFLKGGYDSFLFAPDENYLSTDDYGIFNKFYDMEILNYINTDVKKIYNYKHFFTVPFFNVREKIITEIPVTMLLKIQYSNGMAAGNTPEEALVQGISEILERYSMKEIILKNIVMPDIPEEIWRKYERIKGLKSYIEKCGYKVYIKDASLGGNLPVVCAIFEHNDIFCFKFGAQPSLPIAIERTLTEFMQGGDPNNKFTKIKLDTSNIDRLYLFENISVSTTTIEKTQDKELFDQLFKNKPHYNFTKTAWVEEDKNYTNKELLKFLMTNPDVMKNKDIYVRDASFLNFPSYYIYVPEVSDVYMKNTDIYKGEYYFNIWQNYDGRLINPEDDNIESLISALEFKLNVADFKTRYDVISPLANEYLLLLCHIVNNDYDNVIKYADLIINTDKFKKSDNRFELIRDYFLAKKSKENVDLSEKYSTKETEEFEQFLSHLDFSCIKQIITDANIRYFETQQNKQNTNSRNFDYEINQLKFVLEQKYLKNTPNQMDLSQVFNFV